VTALVATHDPNLIGIADSVLELEDGQIKGNLFRTVRNAPVPPALPLPHYYEVKYGFHHALVR
jgi:ABC-type lipoprotein export system ATPase subunit